MGLLLNLQGKPDIACSEQTITDLQLDELLSGIANVAYSRLTGSQLEQYRTCDPDTIRYRQDIIKDLLANPAILNEMVRLYEELNIWEASFAKQQSANMQDQIQFLPLVENFLDYLFDLDELLKTSSLSSQGLRALEQQLDQLIQKQSLREFAGRWEKLTSGVRQPVRFDILAELDGIGNITSTRLQQISSQHHHSGIFNKTERPTPLHYPKVYVADKDILTADEQTIFYHSVSTNINVVLQAGVREALSWLRQNTRELFSLRDDILFYSAACSLYQSWKEQGMPCSFPSVADASPYLNGLFHPLLLGQNREVILNDWNCESAAELQILTGANQGGKTTYLQSVGIAHWLFELGWAVPAEKAALCPAEVIATLFPSGEKSVNSGGRFAQELEQLSRAVQSVGAGSLVLLNEPFTSVSPENAFNISMDLLCYLKLLGVRGIWVTHLHDLAAQYDLLNGLLPGGSHLSSLIVNVEQLQDGSTRPSYKVTRSKPQHSSFARDVLRRKGVQWI